MAATSLDNEFLSYWVKLTPVQKESLLSVARNFVDVPQDTGRISIEQYNKEIDEAMKRMDAGEFITQDDLEKEAEAW